MDIKKIKKPLMEYVERVKKTLNPKAVILFGSWTHNNATSGSDIDLLVLAEFKNIAKEKRFDILYDLHKDIEANYDFHVYGATPQEFESAKPWTIFEEIKKRGVVLYPRSQ
jgi:predicted nucleotidyltransferase